MEEYIMSLISRMTVKEEFRTSQESARWLIRYSAIKALGSSNTKDSAIYAIERIQQREGKR